MASASAASVPILGAIALGMLWQPSIPVADAGAVPVTFAEVKQIVDQRCHVCHSAKPRFPGFAEAPKGVMFDTPAQIKRLAPQIMAQAVSFGFRVAELPVPTRYFAEASSVNFERSVEYGLDVLRLMVRYTLHRAHVWRRRQFSAGSNGCGLRASSKAMSRSCDQRQSGGMFRCSFW